MLCKKSLAELEPGETAHICRLECEGGIRRRLLDIGLIQETEVECIGRSPCGDPSAYLIRNAVIAIRREDCRKIIIDGEEE